MGGKQMGFSHGQYINNAGQSTGRSLGRRAGTMARGYSERRRALGNVLVTMLKQLGVQADSLVVATAKSKHLCPNDCAISQFVKLFG